MMYRRLTLRMLALLLLPLHGSASEVTYHWPEAPLELELAVGSEQRITIPEAQVLRLGIPREIKHKLQAEIIGNHLWLSAKEDFPPTRLVLLAEPEGRVVLRVRAQHSEKFSQPIVIQKQKSNDQIDSDSRMPSYSFVKLTRWVVQQLYAPERLLSELPGVQRLAVDSSPLDIFRCAVRTPTPCAGAVTATPIGSWQSSHHFITAIKISNNLSQQMILDPRELRGSWRSAAFVHTQLHTQGHPGDTTVLVLISDYPFEISQF